jgi:hypothetical protein
MPRVTCPNRVLIRLAMAWGCMPGIPGLYGLPAAAEAAVAVAKSSVRVTPLVSDMPGACGIAASGNGQTVYCIDEERRAVVSVDAFAPGRRRDVVAPAADHLPMPVAVGCLPGDLLALVCRRGDEWTMQTHRIRPGEAADPVDPLQTLAIGRAGGSGCSPGIAVSRCRDWLAVVGIQPPVAPVLRAVFARAVLRPLSDAGCPAVASGGRPVAIAVSAADEMVILDAPDAAAPATVSFHGPTGRELLRLETGLTNVRGAACARDGSALWVLAGRDDSADQPQGLWRLDAVLRDGRQAVRPECVAQIEEPRAIAAVSDRSVVVVHGTARRKIVRIDPHDDTLKNQEKIAP